jgi:hypothetical protein
MFPIANLNFSLSSSFSFIIVFIDTIVITVIIAIIQHRLLFEDDKDVEEEESGFMQCAE